MMMRDNLKSILSSIPNRTFLSFSLTFCPRIVSLRVIDHKVITLISKIKCPENSEPAYIVYSMHAYTNHKSQKVRKTCLLRRIRIVYSIIHMLLVHICICHMHTYATYTSMSQLILRSSKFELINLLLLRVSFGKSETVGSEKKYTVGPLRGGLTAPKIDVILQNTLPF